MNYWHIQLHPDDKSAFPPDKVKRILLETAYIGMGDWDEGENQIGEFTNALKIGDIVAVRSGQAPIALVEVVGEYEHMPTPNKDLDWFQNRRKVKILDFYKPEYNFYIPKAMGTFSKCSNLKAETSRVIINWCNNVNQSKKMNEIINLLRYKHQIILQGPPGTGKTYTAKKIAKEMTKDENLGSAENKIDVFFKTFDSSSDEIQARRKECSMLMQEFKTKFPADQLKNLTLQKYCIGTGEKENFCWWIERGLKPLGYYFPGTSRSYMIYWDKSSGEYSTHFRHSKTLSAAADIEDAMHRLADIISDLVINKSGEAFKVFGDSLILKILHSYYPDEFFPVNSVKYLDNILKMMNVDASNLSFLEKNLKVQDIYLKKNQFFNRDVTNIEFMRFLADNFDLKGDIQIKDDSIIAAGEYKLIQFHPAYTYEDFVRGITAKTNKDGHVHYKVENKILAQFAQKADDNPSSNYVLIIDEINRANLPSVLGELIYALEYRYDKEKPDETSVESMYALECDDPDIAESKKLKLPGNLYIIGTMNTADRSVGHIDYAIRRRFAFVEILPKIIPELTEKGKELFYKVAVLFCKEFVENNSNLESSEFIAPDFNPTDVMPGHSYFLIQDKERAELNLPDEEILKLKLEFEIKPILREYKKDGILLETAGDVIESLDV